MRYTNPRLLYFTLLYSDTHTRRQTRIVKTIPAFAVSAGSKVSYKQSKEDATEDITSLAVAGVK